MTRALAKRQLSIAEGAKLLGFDTTGSSSWPAFDRFLTIEGKPAFHIGNICETCSFVFERLPGANRSVQAEAVRAELNAGVEDLELSVATQLAELLPSGSYLAMLLEMQPKLVDLGARADYFATEQISTWGLDGFWALPHSPRIRYYRGATAELAPGQVLYEFLVPMTPQTWLDPERVAFYERTAGDPTAVALSVLDVKAPAVEVAGAKDVHSHWCLAHYLLDGHHKTMAAVRQNRPLRIISFVALDRGISNTEQVEELALSLERGVG